MQFGIFGCQSTQNLVPEFTSGRTCCLKLCKRLGLGFCPETRRATLILLLTRDTHEGADVRLPSKTVSEVQLAHNLNDSRTIHGGLDRSVTARYIDRPIVSVRAASKPSI